MEGVDELLLLLLLLGRIGDLVFEEEADREEAGCYNCHCVLERDVLTKSRIRAMTVQGM